MTPHAIIADDEPNLGEYLKTRLAILWPELAIDGVARNGPEALKMLDDLAPQIAFLDIKMPGLTGLEVASRLDGQVHVVFVTAYDEYAVTAFEREAADYLLKPVTDARLAKTIARLKARLGAGSHAPDLSELLRQLSRNSTPTGQHLHWVRAGQGSDVKQIAVANVLYFDAADKYTRVITDEGEALIRTTIRELLEQLDPQVFAQIHRGTIVNMHYVAGAVRDDSGQVSVKLKGRKERLAVSRAYSHLFKQM
jgi:DNA-binding LytR/AlgR family response regulator